MGDHADKNNGYEQLTMVIKQEEHTLDDNYQDVIIEQNNNRKDKDKKNDFTFKSKNKRIKITR